MYPEPKAAFVAVLAASLAGTVASSPATAQEACTPGETGRIAFMLKHQKAFRYLNADVPFFVRTAEDDGYEVLVQSADHDAAKQVAQAENVITQGVDAIVILPVDFHVAAVIAEKATDAGIALASYDDLIPGAEQTAFIGRDPREGGASAAPAVSAAAPKGNYALIGSDPGQSGSTQMQEGYHLILAPLVEKGDIALVLDQFSSGWKTDAAQAHAENALTQNDKAIDAFLVSYEGMSVRVLQAIEGAGIAPGSIPVTGQNMDLAAAQAIVEGRMFGSIWPAPDEMAEAGANTAIAMAKCEAIGAVDTINNEAANILWVKTPIYLVGHDEIAKFVCSHPHWLDIDEVYKNVPDQKPTCG